MSLIKLKSIVPYPVKCIFRDGVIRECAPGGILIVDENERGLHDGPQGPFMEVGTIQIPTFQPIVTELKKNDDIEQEKITIIYADDSEDDLEDEPEEEDPTLKALIKVQEEIKAEPKQIAPEIKMPRNKGGRPPKKKG